MTTPDTAEAKIARWIYEATRVEAEWSERPIVPEPWEKRDDKFRNQFVDIIDKYMAMDKLPTPAEAHESWNQSYYKMGWKYGPVRDTEAKTHPDLVPFEELPQPEKDKDAIFLAFVWLAKQLKGLLVDAQKVDGNTSDGYHTFNELYRYRLLYNAALFNEWYTQGKYDIHKSERHSDGELCFGGGWFVVVAQLPTGQVTNHYELKDWYLFKADIRKRAAKWDGHTPEQAAQRLLNMLPEKPEPYDFDALHRSDKRR